MKMKKLHILAIVALILPIFTSCEKAKTSNDALADTFVKIIKDDQGRILYAPVCSVFSPATKITSATAVSPYGTILSLSNFENGGMSFFNVPTENDYSIDLPPAGDYTFKVKFDGGEEKVYTDVLTDQTISPANITSLTKSANGDTICIRWDAIANVSAYQLRITKGTTMVFYQSSFSDISTPKKANLKAGVLISSLINHEPGTYTVELNGLLFEPSSTDYLQAITSSKMDIQL
jgi:hypothetical protein